MIGPRFSTPVLFSKISTNDQELIIKGFPEHYRAKADNPSKYNNKQLEQEIIDHFLLYEQTRPFNDRELVVLVGIYCATELRPAKVAIKYPEFFV